MSVKLKSYTEHVLTAGGGTVNLSPSAGSNYYIFSGTATLTNNWTIQYDPAYPISETEGMWVELIWRADITLNGRTVNILGNTLTQKQVNNNSRALFEYDGSAWTMFWTDSADAVKTVTSFNVVSGNSDTVNSNVDYFLLKLSGTTTLASDYTLSATGTPQEGDRFKVFVDANVTLNGNNLTIFGTNIDELTALTGNYIVDTVYDGSSWVTAVTGKAQKEYQDIYSVNQISSSTSVTIDSYVEVDASSAPVTVTLPTAVGNSGKKVTITKTDSSANIVKIDGNGAETVNGDLSFNLEVEEEAITVISNGTNWRII